MKISLGLTRASIPVVLCLWLLSGCDADPFCLTCAQYARDRSDADILDDGGDDADSADPYEGLEGGPGCVVGAEERCNGIDDNCDGLVDDGFDLMSDPRHCGKCDNACQFPNADSKCELGECVQLDCLEGYADLDPDEPGCEYRCPVFPEQGEQCNGLDDDCDGEVDEPDEIDPPAVSPCRTTANTPCEDTELICDTREGTTTWYCDYSSDVEFDPSIPNGIVEEETLCDGEDGDCDGVADDSFETLGDPCSRGEGVCATTGERVCNDDGDDVECDAPEPEEGTDEICNGVDDDCDGEIDEEGYGEMVQIDDFFIDVYEASRPTAQSGTYTCSVAGATPWTSVTHAEAEAACAAVDKRLCTVQEWERACAGSSANPENVYPYGATFIRHACNGVEHVNDCLDVDEARVQPTGTPYGCPDPPAESACVSEEGVYDMSGNVREWTATEVSGSPGNYRIRGGSYENQQAGLKCGSDFQLAAEDFLLDNLGFRCCKDAE